MQYIVEFMNALVVIWIEGVDGKTTSFAVNRPISIKFLHNSRLIRQIRFSKNLQT